MSDKMDWAGWAGVGAIAGVAAVIVALFAWLLPFQSAQTAGSPASTESVPTAAPQTTAAATPTTTTSVVPPPVSEHVTHPLNRVISDEDMLRVTLASIEVSPQVIKATLVYHNYGADSYGLGCEDAQDLTGTYLYYEMQRITATNSFCFSNPGMELDLQPGESMASWAEYPNALPTTGAPFSFHWYEYGNVADIQF